DQPPLGRVGLEAAAQVESRAPARRLDGLVNNVITHPRPQDPSGPASVIGASSIVGRLGLGALGAKVGPVRLMQASFGVMAGSYAIWLVADGRYSVLVTFAIVLGVGYGGFIALSPAAVAVMFGTNGMATILGATYTGAGIGGLVGPPLAGAIIDGAGFNAGISYALITAAISTVVLYTLPVSRSAAV
ncbi:MAG: MFS transporter, partial [Ilumatobacteraceae bacterium]